MAPEHPGPPPWRAPLVSSLGIPDSHPDGKPANGGHGRLFWHGPASPSLACPRCALGGALGALMRSSPPPPLPPPHAAILGDPTRPSLPSRTYIRPPSTQYRGPGPERVGPQATLLHPPCTNPMASPLWVDGRWMGDLKEPAGGGGEGGATPMLQAFIINTSVPPRPALALSRVPLPCIPILIFTHPLLLFSSQVGLCVWELETSGCSLIPPAARFPESPLRETPCPSCATRRPRCAAGPIRTSLGA